MVLLVLSAFYIIGLLVNVLGMTVTIYQYNNYVLSINLSLHTMYALCTNMLKALCHKTFLICTAVQFIFTPSPNIELYQLAHYQCSVDHTGVTITWNINETGYGHNDNIIQLGIVTSGVPQQSNLTIHGYPYYNNTKVKCIAAGSVNSSDYIKSSKSTLRIQGNTLSDICHYISFH